MCSYNKNTSIILLYHVYKSLVIKFVVISSVREFLCINSVLYIDIIQYWSDRYTEKTNRQGFS